MTEFMKVALTSEIPEGTLKRIKVGNRQFVVAHTADGFYAVRDECTHEAVPLSDGGVDGNEIICAAHGARFDLKSGAVAAPPAIVPLETIELKIEGDEIFVSLKQ